MADTWFTSDFHLGHFNIIRYCNRPFADTREMNAAILERLNALVKPDDVGVPGFFCTSGVDTNWDQRSGIWHEGKSIVLSRW